MAWLVIIGVGVASYGMRVAPFLLGASLGPNAQVDRVIRHASTAAITALVVSSTLGASGDGSLGPSLVAVGSGAVLARSGRSMLVVVTVGMAAFWLARVGWDHVPL